MIVFWTKKTHWYTVSLGLEENRSHENGNKTVPRNLDEMVEGVSFYFQLGTLETRCFTDVVKVMGRLGGSFGRRYYYRELVWLLSVLLINQR